MRPRTASLAFSHKVNGKQRISAIPSPGGDTYTPSSGIWQTVWLENVPETYVSALKFTADLTSLHLNVTATAPGTVSGSVSFANATVATFSGSTASQIDVVIPSPRLWHPTTPNLYQFSLTYTDSASGATDTVGSYFGMRTVTMSNFTSPPTPATGPRIGMDNSGGACLHNSVLECFFVFCAWACFVRGRSAVPFRPTRTLFSGDMPNMPVVLPKSDYNLCWAMCNQTAGCNGWSYGVDGAGCETQPLCWLKANPGSWGANPCRIAGNQAQPGGNAKRLSLNGNFTFLAGFLDQSWWSDGEVWGLLCLSTP